MCCQHKALSDRKPSTMPPKPEQSTEPARRSSRVAEQPKKPEPVAADSKAPASKVRRELMQPATVQS